MAGLTEVQCAALDTRSSKLKDTELFRDVKIRAVSVAEAGRPNETPLGERP